jgi:hypothetical protein
MQRPERADKAVDAGGVVVQTIVARNKAKFDRGRDH